MLAVGRTARIITSAAVIMFIVFCAFTVGRVVANKSIGLGLAVAVRLTPRWCGWCWCRGS